MRRCVVVLALLIGVGVCLVACGREEGGVSHHSGPLWWRERCEATA